VATIAQNGIRAVVTQTTDRRVADFDAGLRELIEAVAHEADISSMRLRTVAGHDAVSLATRFKSAMIFVPSANGISHNAEEFTASEDLEAGARVLAGVLAHLVRN